VNEVLKSETAQVKQAWVQPELQRIEAGSAESAEAGNFDASSPQRS
jgi:hypothetical protein